MNPSIPVGTGRATWNKGKLVGQKPPLKLKEVWSIRTRLQLAGHLRDLALLNLAIDSKLRACDLVGLRVTDISKGGHIAHRAIVLQKKTQRPVQFEITEQTRHALCDWIARAGLGTHDYLFPSRIRSSTHISVRQYSRLVKSWVADIGPGSVLLRNPLLTADKGGPHLQTDE